MTAKYFATRSAINPTGRDEDGAAAHEQLGPFASNTDTRRALAEHLGAKLAQAAGPTATSIQRMYVTQYAGILTAMAADTSADQFEADGVRWTITAVTDSEHSSSV